MQRHAQRPTAVGLVQQRTAHEREHRAGGCESGLVHDAEAQREHGVLHRDVQRPAEFGAQPVKCGAQPGGHRQRHLRTRQHPGVVHIEVREQFAERLHRDALQFGRYRGGPVLRLQHARKRREFAVGLHERRDVAARIGLEC